MNCISRRTAVKAALIGGVAFATNSRSLAENLSKKKNREAEKPLKRKIRHSVSKWSIGEYPLDEFCEICKEIGIQSIELFDPKDWPIVKSYGLTVAIAQVAGLGIDREFRRDEIDETQELYYPTTMKALFDTGYKGFVGQEFVPKQADKIASLKKCICICDI